MQLAKQGSWEELGLDSDPIPGLDDEPAGDFQPVEISDFLSP